MRKLIVIYFGLFLSFSSCMIEGDHETSLLLESIIRMELVSKDTLFISDPVTKPISYQINYYNSEGLVSLNNAFQPKILLDGEAVESLKIDLSKERQFLVEAELPNQKKLRSNEVRIRVLDLKNAISKINLSLKGTSIIIIPQLKEYKFDDLFRIELELLNGEKMVVNFGFFNFGFLLNNELQEGFDFKNFIITGEGKINVKFKELISNSVNLNFYKIEDAVTALSLSFKGINERLIKYEDKGTIKDYFLIKATLVNGEEINFNDYPQFFKLFSNGIDQSNFNVLSLPEGKNVIQSKIGNTVSNSLEIEIINPNNFIKSIELSFSDSTNNPFALGGISRYDFEYKVIGNDDKELAVKTELMLQNIKQSGFEKILIPTSGEVRAIATAYGKQSDPLIINSRVNKSYPLVRIPLIFHILPNYAEREVITQSKLESIIKDLNKAFANTYYSYTGASKKNPSAVSVFIEFYLAEVDPEGKSLSEKGIHRASDMRSFIKWPPATSDTKYLFDEMWDPTKYLNLFLSKIESVGGFAYPPVLRDFQLPGIGKINSTYSLNYPYVAVSTDTGIELLAHEIGHMLGLNHSWRNSSSFCGIDVDYCADTDGVVFDRHISGLFYKNCQNQKILDFDFMSASLTNCFTYDQRERIRRVLENNPFLPVSGINSRKVPFQKGLLDYSVKPVD